MAARVMLAILGLGSNCEESRKPWWLPGKALMHNEVAPVYGQAGLRLLCCGGKIGGIPKDPRAIALWKTHMGEQYAILDTSDATCADDQAFPRLGTSLESANSATCPPRHHFPSAEVGTCSGAFNPETKLAEFAKCCSSRKMGQHGTIHSERTGMWVFPTESACRRSTCPVSVSYECPSAKHYASVDSNGTGVCVVLPRIKEYAVEAHSSCGWDDLQSRIGSSDSLPACLDECSSQKTCRTVELHIGEPSLCILRSETCGRRKGDDSVHTYVKKEVFGNHSGYGHAPHHVVLIVILASAIIGLTLLMGSIFLKGKD